MLEELKTARRVVGMKQLKKALAAGEVKKVFLAEDADPALTTPLRTLCEAQRIPLVSVATMRQLGEACEISVEAAVAAIL